MKKLFSAFLALSLLLTGCGAKSSSTMSNAYASQETAAANDSYSYDIQIRSVEKGADDDSLPISSY